MNGSPFQQIHIDRRRTLAGIGALGIAGLVPGFGSRARAELEPPPLPSPPLAEIAAPKNLLFASWLPFSAFNLPDQPASWPRAPDEIAKVYLHECAAYVADAKNNEIMQSDGSLNMIRPKRIFDFVKPTGRPLIWCTPFWDYASPYIAAIHDRAHGIATLKAWIQTFLTYWGDYPIHSIQVVNELHYPWSKHKWGYQTQSSTGGPHPWLAAIGDDAPELAFRFAAEVAAPSTKLILNEQTWALTSGNWGAYDRNRENILATLRRWLDKGVPIHGLGLQLHVAPGFQPIGRRLLPGNGDFMDAQAQLKFLDEVAALGLEIHLTEFDCTDLYLAGKSTAERRAVCAAYARELLPPLLAHKSVRSFQVFGLTDSRFDSYLVGLPEFDRPDKRWGDRQTVPPPREAMLYDADIRPKPLRAAIADVLAGAPQRA